MFALTDQREFMAQLSRRLANLSAQDAEKVSNDDVFFVCIYHVFIVSAHIGCWSLIIVVVRRCDGYSPRFVLVSRL
jgi:hypothetical protein